MAGRREIESSKPPELATLLPGELEKAVHAIQVLSSIGLSTKAATPDGSSSSQSCSASSGSGIGGSGGSVSVGSSKGASLESGSGIKSG